MKLSLDDGELFYEISGSGPPLLFLHAGVADSRMWVDVVERLTDNFTCIVCDLRGYGKSFLPDGSFSYVEDAATLVRHISTTPVWLVGASFGASVAIDVALVQPDLVKGLVLASPAVGGFSPVAEVLEFVEKEDELLELDRLEEATTLNVEMWVDGPHRSPEGLDPAIRNLVYDMQLLAFKHPEPANVVFEKPLIAALARLTEIQKPTLIVAGALDNPEFVTMSRTLVNGIASSEYMEMANAAHMLTMEHPSEFADMVTNYVGLH